MGGVYLIAFARQTAGKIKRRNGILWSGEETSNWGHRENVEMVTKADGVEWSGVVEQPMTGWIIYATGVDVGRWVRWKHLIKRAAAGK